MMKRETTTRRHQSRVTSRGESVDDYFVSSVLASRQFWRLEEERPAGTRNEHGNLLAASFVYAASFTIGTIDQTILCSFLLVVL
jgi:hypothetical protein